MTLQRVAALFVALVTLAFPVLALIVVSFVR